MEWLRSKICTPKCDIDPPKKKYPIDHTEILTLLKAEFGEECHIYLSDIDYNTVTKQELQRFLKNDKTNYNKYVADVFDCDDFSYRLLGEITIGAWCDIPFGILWVDTPNGGHAVNVFVDKSRSVWIVEPANDNIFKLPDDWTPGLVVL